METITRKVDELSSPDRAALEHMLGRELGRDQHIVVIAYGAGESQAQVREAARARILALLDKAAHNAVAAGVTAEEADAAIEEAMAVVRPRIGR